MPQSVVDQLEPVQVHVEHGEAVVGLAFAAADRPLQPVQEQRAVGQIRQGVVERGVYQLRLQPLALGDVLGDSQKLPRAAAGVARHYHHARAHPPVFAHRVLHPVFGFERFALAQRVVAVILRQHGAQVVRVHRPRDEFAAEGANLFKRVSQRPLIGAVDEEVPVFGQIVDEEQGRQGVAELMQERGLTLAAPQPRGAGERAYFRHGWPLFALGGNVAPKADPLRVHALAVGDGFQRVANPAVGSIGVPQAVLELGHAIGRFARAPVHRRVAVVGMQKRHPKPRVLEEMAGRISQQQLDVFAEEGKPRGRFRIRHINHRGRNCLQWQESVRPLGVPFAVSIGEWRVAHNRPIVPVRQG